MDKGRKELQKGSLLTATLVGHPQVSELSYSPVWYDSVVFATFDISQVLEFVRNYDIPFNRDFLCALYRP